MPVLGIEWVINWREEGMEEERRREEVVDDSTEHSPAGYCLLVATL